MSDPGPSAGERRPFLPLALCSIAVSSVFILSMLSVTEGRFVPQVSDLYLIAQYAKGFAEGHPFQYNPGEAPTTGATSLLHTLFLAGAHLVGFRGEGLIAFAVLSGAGFAFLTALQVYRAGALLSGSSRVAMLGALMVVLNGPLAWAFHYGADICLTLFLTSWLFRAWLEGAGTDEKGPTRFVLPACLLVLTRPEGAVLVLVLAAWSLWDAPPGRRFGRRAVWWSLPVLAAGVVPLLFRVLTGSAANTSFSQKLLTSNWGFFSAAVLSVEYWSDLLRGVLLGFYPASQRLGLSVGNAPYFAPPFLLIFVFLGLLNPSPVIRRARAFLLAALVTALAVTPTIQIGAHSNRYLLFALAPLLILLSLGLDTAAAWIESALQVPRALTFRRLAALALVFSLLSVTRYALAYADAASSVYRRDEALFEFIRTSLPADASFLVNGTAIEFRTGRRGINLSGVVTPGFSDLLPAETEASAFEILSRPGAGTLPPYLIAFDSYIAGSPAWPALVSGPPVFVTSSLEAAELAIYPTRGDLLGKQVELLRLEMPAGLVRVDALNVTDPLEESSHGYQWSSSVGTRSLFATLKLDRYLGVGRGAGSELADGGRVIMGFETMEVATPIPGSDLWVAVRTNPEPSARMRHPDGERRVDFALKNSAVRFSTGLGRTDWIRTSLEPGWNEVAYRIPATLVRDGVTRIMIEGRYSAYYYYFYQGTLSGGFARRNQVRTGSP